MQLLYLIPLLVTASLALNVTAPTDDQVIDISEPFDITWTSESTDPAQVSIDVVNATPGQGYVLVNNVRGANVSEGHYELRWANAIPSDTASYQLVFLNYATGEYVAQSAVFNLTLPPGEVRDTSAGDAPASPGTNDPEKPSSTGLSAGEIAAAVIVPIIVAILILGGAYYFWRRKRRQPPTTTFEDDEPRKPELDASGRAISKPGHDSAELTGESGPRNSISKHQSAELSGEKGFIRWELPTTPPRTSAEPVEMPAEVPLAEMSAIEMEHPQGTSGNGSTIVGSTNVDDRISPLLSQNGSVQNSLQHTRNSDALDVLITHGEGASSTNGKTRFQEALYDIISDELRRPDAPAKAHDG